MIKQRNCVPKAQFHVKAGSNRDFGQLLEQDKIIRICVLEDVYAFAHLHQ